MSLPNFQLPNQKEWGAGVGGLLAFVIIWALNHFGVTFGAQGDATLAGALVTLLPLAIAKIVPASDQDILHRVNDTIAQAGVLTGQLTAASDQAAPVTPAAAALAAKVS